MIWFLLFIPIILIHYILFKCIEFWGFGSSEWVTITRTGFAVIVMLSLIPFVNILVLAASIISIVIIMTDGNARFRESTASKFLSGRL